MRKVRHTETDEIAAVKFVDKKTFTHFEDLQRVFTEIQILRDLHHPNIIRIIDVHDHPDNVCFFMESYGTGLFGDLVCFSFFSSKPVVEYVP